MKKIAFIIILMISVFTSNSQNNNYHWFEKNGKIYYNKNLPVYFWISTSPDDNSKDVLMTSHSTKKYANPMYFDTEGYNTFQCRTIVDTAKKYNSETSVVYKIYSDGYAPTLDVYFLGTRTYGSNSKTTYKSGLKVKFSAKDFISGIENIYFSINSQQYQKYTEPVIFNTSGDYNLKVYAIDNTGNSSKTESYNFSIK